VLDITVLKGIGNLRKVASFAVNIVYMGTWKPGWPAISRSSVFSVTAPEVSLLAELDGEGAPSTGIGVITGFGSKEGNEVELLKYFCKSDGS
jgi:hypothetical protein